LGAIVGPIATIVSLAKAAAGSSKPEALGSAALMLYYLSAKYSRIKRLLYPVRSVFEVLVYVGA
jgi:hypothetical protein